MAHLSELVGAHRHNDFMCDASFEVKEKAQLVGFALMKTGQFRLHRDISYGMRGASTWMMVRCKGTTILKNKA